MSVEARRWMPPKGEARIRVVEPYEPFCGFEVLATTEPIQCRRPPPCVFCEMEAERLWARLRRRGGQRLASFVGTDVAGFVR